MKTINFYKSDVIISLIAFKLILLVNYFLYSYYIPNYIVSEYSSIGLMGKDSYMYHTLALEIKSLILNNNLTEVFQVRYFRFPNTIVMGFLYCISESAYIVMVFNSLLFLLSAFYLTQLASLFIRGLQKNIISILFVLTLFLPTSIFIFSMNGKDPYMITAIIILIYNIIYFHQLNSNIYRIYSINNFINFIFFLIALFIIFLFRFYISYLVIFTLVGSMLLIFLINIFIEDKIKINFINLIIIIFLIVIANFLFENVNILKVTHELSHPQNFEMYNSIWVNTYFVPDFIESKLRILSELRYHFVSHSLASGIEGDSIIEQHILPNNAIGIIKYIPRLILLGLISPTPDLWSNFNSLTDLLNSLEMLFFYLVFSSIIINYRSINFLTIFIILTSITFISLYFYINPNIGTLIRLRFPFLSFLIFLGIYNWLIIFKNVYVIIKKYFYPKNKPNEKNSFFNVTNSLVINSLLLIITSIIIFTRDMSAIGIFNQGIKLDIFLVVLILLSFISNTIVTPISDTLSYLKSKSNISTSDEFNSYIKNNFYTTTAIIIVITIFLIIFNNNIISLFNIKEKINFNIFLYISPIIIFITFNSFLSSFLYNKNKTYMVYLSQLIVPSVSCIIILKLDLVISHIILSITFLTLINSFFLAYFSHINGLDLKYFIKKKSFVINYNHNYFKYLFILISNQLFVALIIILTYILISVNDSENFAVFAFSFKFILFTSSLFIAISTGIFTPFLKKTFNDNQNDMHFSIIIILYLSIFSIAIFSLFFSVFMKHIIFLLFNLDYIDIIYVNKTLFLCLLFTPILIYNHLIQKILILNQKYLIMSFSNLCGLFSFIILNYLYSSGNIENIFLSLIVSFSIAGITMIALLNMNTFTKLLLILPLLIYYILIMATSYS